MSFILDALKKLEQKRHQGSIPNLLTVHEPAPPEPKSRSLWHYLLVVALLLNAGILLLWLHPWQSEKPEVTTESTTHETKVAEKVPAPKLKSPAAPAKTPFNELPRHQPVQDKANLQRKVEMMDSPEGTSVKQEQASINKPSTTKLQLPADVGIETEQRILNLDELPLAVRQDLPDLTISGHIYSNEPTSRLVNINGQIIREGQAVRNGLKLMEITPTGAIFSYKGYRFCVKGF